MKENTKRKIKLISPKVSLRPMDTDLKRQMSPPLALLVLAALTPSEFDVEIADENIEKIHLTDADLVGITVKADTFYRSCDIAEQYRKRGIPVIMGGIHPTACPEDCRDHADAIVIGDAEELWGQVVKDFENGQLRPVYRKLGRTDIGSAPIPRWELLHGNSYLFTNTLCIGRGCPWQCDFCYNSSNNLDSGYRMKPIPNILKEIESLKTRHVMFIDDNFIGNPDKARVLLKELIPLKLTWHTAVSADIGKYDDILDLMAEAGCKSLFIGFESVNSKNLLSCHKGQNKIEQYDQTIAKIHQRHMMVNASLVFGFDHDDSSVFKTTLNWLVRNKVETMTSHILTPYPGTRFYQRLQNENRILDHDLRKYNTAYAVFQPKQMSARELQDGYQWIYSQFYSFRNIIKRCPSWASGQVIPYVAFALAYRKFGKQTCYLSKLFGMRNLAKFAKALSYPAKLIPAKKHGKVMVNSVKLGDC